MLKYCNVIQGEISGKRVTDLDLEEFLSYGPQREQRKVRSLNNLRPFFLQNVTGLPLSSTFSGRQATAPETQGREDPQVGRAVRGRAVHAA